MFRRAVLLAAAVAAATSVPLVPSAAAAAAPQHCVAHVVDQRADGELVLSETRCYSTFQGAMRSEGVAAWGEGAAEKAAAAQPGVAALSFTLAIHYDNPNQNASAGSFSVTGTNCSGGYLNMTPSWNNRVSSTTNGCPNVTHYDLINLGGAWYTTTGSGGNLGSLSDRVSSVRYH